MTQQTQARRSSEPSSRRAEILTAATELFARKGFAGTTVRDIAEAVGILSGSLYHHFTAKEEMVEEIFNAYFDELARRWEVALAEPADSATTFEVMMRCAMQNVDSHTAAARLFTQEWLDLRHLGDFAARWEQIERTWLEVIDAAIAEGTFRSDLDPMLIFSMSMDVIRGLSGWYHRDGRFPIGDICDAYIAMLMSGITVGSEANVPPARPAR